MSRYELAIHCAQALGKPKEMVEGFSFMEIYQKGNIAKRPRDSSLSNQLLLGTLGIEGEHYKEAIKRELAFFLGTESY